MIECPMHEGGFDCTPFCELCAGEQEIRKPKDYRLNAYADGFGVWHCEIFFTTPLGNTGEADRVAANAMRAAKRAIRKQLELRAPANAYNERFFYKRLSYEVKSNKFELGSGRLLSLTIAEK